MSIKILKQEGADRGTLEELHRVVAKPAPGTWGGEDLTRRNGQRPGWRRLTARDAFNRSVGAFLVSAFFAAAAQATDPTVAVELNKLEPRGEACRAYLVLKNDTESAFESLRLDLVMFDADGVVARRVAVEAAPLSSGRTSLKMFDIGDLACERIGRLLLNGIIACEDGSGERADCVSLISPSSRHGVPFIK